VLTGEWQARFRLQYQWMILPQKHLRRKVPSVTSHAPSLRALLHNLVGSKNESNLIIPMRVLIAEDDPALATFVQKGLEAEHYAVDVTHDGEQAKAMATELDYDLFMLDLNLPRMDGIAILRHLRPRKPSMPILVLTSRNRVEDRVQCLDLGADDYMGKPFSFTELSARIRALLRRSHLPAASVLTVADLKLDRVERKVERASKRIDLTSKEFGLLEYLMLNAGRRVSRTMIIEHVWNLSFDTGTNVIDVYVNYLASCKLSPYNTAGLIQLDLGIAFALIDMLLGGEGQGPPPSRDITEIEEQVAETLMQIVFRELQITWQTLAVEFQFEQRRQLGEAQQLMALEERMLCLGFEVALKERRGGMTIAIPTVISSALLRKLSAVRPRFYTRPDSGNFPQPLRKLLLKCPFRLDLGLSARALSSELAEIHPGKVVVLNRMTSAPGTLFARERPIFSANVARVGQMRAAQILSAIEPPTESKPL
jgi:two-component system, OmpR family, copper resistance phosphate regulon response regulator CusR